MKLIRELNDRIVLDQEGMSNKAPRLTAQAIVKNHRNQHAVMCSHKFNLYTLPEGGVEEGEEVLLALNGRLLKKQVVLVMRQRSWALRLKTGAVLIIPKSIALPPTTWPKLI